MSQCKLKHVFWQEADIKGINARKEESVQLTMWVCVLCYILHSQL